MFKLKMNSTLYWDKQWKHLRVESIFWAKMFTLNSNSTFESMHENTYSKLLSQRWYSTLLSSGIKNSILSKRNQTTLLKLASRNHIIYSMNKATTLVGSLLLYGKIKCALFRTNLLCGTIFPTLKIENKIKFST